MLGENHGLVYEFPDHVDTINHLKQTDERFALMAREYHKLDHQIRGLENNDVPTSDEHFMELKGRRVELKDQLYQRLLNGDR